MRRYRLTVIVEGHGEQEAVPLLVQRWLNHRKYHNFDVTTPAIRAPGCGALKTPHVGGDDLGVEYYVRLALNARPDAILILLDADDECNLEMPVAQRLGPRLLKRARAVASHIPMSVVVATREYEAWFLADVESLISNKVLPLSAKAALKNDLGRLESLCDAKGRLAQLLGRAYDETVDQMDLTRLLTFGPRIVRRVPSYGKFLRDLQMLTRRARQGVNNQSNNRV
jgi:hypothetical protein